MGKDDLVRLYEIELAQGSRKITLRRRPHVRPSPNSMIPSSGKRHINIELGAKCEHQGCAAAA